MILSEAKRRESRNLIDHYHYWTNEAIKADLDTKRNNFYVVCSNIGYDFNIASVIRSANAFLAKEIMIVGRRKYDRRGTVGTHIYSNIKFTNDELELKNYLQDKHVVAIEITDSAQSLEGYQWPQDRPVAMIFGQEQIGVDHKILSLANDIIYIKQYGSVRSLNVGCAAAITMYDYCLKVVK